MPYRFVFFCSVFFLLTFSAWSQSESHRTEANVPIELTFQSSKKHTDPFNTVQLNVRFTDTKGGSKLVPAFWDGDQTWKVRYASPVIGKHQLLTECNDTSDTGLHKIKGTVDVSAYRGTNPLFKHGPIQIASDKRHFQHTDGTPFFWLGDTWWMGLCHRLHWPDEFKQLAADRKQKGFNVIQIVAGLYPDMHPFDPRGANEAGFPWTTNYTSIRPEYFTKADERMRYLVDEGFAPCIVGAWGYFLPWMGVEKAKQHWRELIARYGAWPVIWCVAGEANLPWYLAKGFPYDDRELVRGWTQVARYLRETDPFHRPMTIHPTGIGKLNARWAIDEPALIDFDMLQTPHGQSEAVVPTVAAFNHAYNLPPKMPVLNGEASYEMLNGQIAAEWTRAMFWVCMINGAGGHTYGANGIWQVNRREQPHGPSPHHSGGVGYGIISWDDAMRLPGSQQVGDAKNFLMQFPWNRCVPQPDTVKWKTSPAPSWKNWIWYPEGDSRTDAPVEARFFRRTFNISTSSKLQRATLHIVADDKASVWVNGTKAGEASSWQTPLSLDVAALLRPGKNVIAVQADNLPAPVKLNPAGMMAVLETISENGNTSLFSDDQWLTSQKAADDWQSADFNDSQWVKAKIVAAYGEGPWGPVGNNSQAFVPYALGIEDKLRIVYALSPRPVIVTNLRPSSRYQLLTFDPVTGEIVTQMIRTDERGEWQSQVPSHGHDWAFALQLK